MSKLFEILQARMWGIHPQRLTVPGFLLTPDRNLLANYAREVGAKGEIVEIGSFWGLSAIIMGLANPYVKITCIDSCDASGDEISMEGYLQVIGADICKQYYLPR